MTGGKIVYPDHVLAEGEQFLKQTGSNEPSHSGYEPNLGSRDEIVAKTSVYRGDHKRPWPKCPQDTRRTAQRGSSAIRSDFLHNVAVRRRGEGIFHSLHQSPKPARNSCQHKLLAVWQRRCPMRHPIACRDTAPFLW